MAEFSDKPNSQKTDRRERMIGVVLLVFGLAIAGGALLKIQQGPMRVAQANADRVAQSNSQPAESEPGGTRPTTPAPEPARPPQAAPGGTTGNAPSATQDRPAGVGTPLPPAPAEKTAPPIEPKK